MSYISQKQCAWLKEPHGICIKVGSAYGVGEAIEHVDTHIDALKRSTRARIIKKSNPVDQYNGTIIITHM